MYSPKISVVTPSFNQGKFIEKTILSVINQQYPNVEYIIIDGGSSDDTVSIIKKYEEKISFWVSESDRGQAHAINKGFQRATGDILCWINSDDWYELGVFDRIAKISCQLQGAWLLTGHCRFWKGGEIKWEPPVKNTDDILQSLDYTALDLLQCWKFSLAQPSTFWSRQAFEKTGNISEELYFAMDLDYWLRLIDKKVPFYFTKRILSNFLYHTDSKTMSDKDRLYTDLQKLSQDFLKNERDRKEYHKALNFWYYGLSRIRKAAEIVQHKRWPAIQLLSSAIRKQPGSLFLYPQMYIKTLAKAVIGPHHFEKLKKLVVF